MTRLVTSPYHKEINQSIFQVFQAVARDFTKATALKAVWATLVFFLYHLRAHHTNLQRTSTLIPSPLYFSFHCKPDELVHEGSWPVPSACECLQTHCSICSLASSWVIAGSAGCQSGHRSDAPLPTRPENSTWEVKWALGRLADLVQRKEHPWVTGSFNVKDELKPLLPVRNCTLHNP